MSVDVGYGSDVISLNMAEDQQAGVDAQFTVNVDGQQIGGVQSVSASQSDGQTQTFNFYGDYAPGQHNVTVTFVNNWSMPGTPGDRNLYVDGVSYDGQTVSDQTTPIYQSPMFPPNSTVGNVYGNAVFQVNDTTSIPSGTTPEPSTTPGAVSVGDGPDTLVLNMAEDPYQGDAKFTVSVDGQQIGGVQTTTAVVSEGQTQEFDVHGNFGSGSHDVSVDFLNDKIGGFYSDQQVAAAGLPSGQQWAVDNTDRNLYVMGASMDGGPQAPNTPWELSNTGSQDFTVVSGNDPSAGTSAMASVSAAALGTNTNLSFISPNQDQSGSSNTSDTSSGNSTPSTDTSVLTSGGSQTSTQDFTVPTVGNDPTASSSTPAGAWTNYQDTSANVVPVHTS